MKKILTLFVLCIALDGLFAQVANTFTNNGANITVMPGALVTVNQDSLTNLSGTIDNSGTIRIVRDNLNNNNSINNQGLIEVQGTLTNNTGATITGTGDK